MRLINRKNVARFSALVLVLMLLFSFTASYAASFSKSGAGVKYKSKTFKLGSSVTSSDLKKAFGSWSSRKKDDGCTCGYATYLYNFKSKGIKIETLQKKKSDKKEKIITITITKKTVPTIAGVKVGSSTNTVFKKYGKKYGKSGSKLRFHSGKYNLVVYTKKNAVTKLEFILDL